MTMGPQSDLALLDHIRARVARIDEYTNRERSKFYGSHLVQDAVVRNLQTIAESTQRLRNGLRGNRSRSTLACNRGFSQRAGR